MYKATNKWAIVSLHSLQVIIPCKWKSGFNRTYIGCFNCFLSLVYNIYASDSLHLFKKTSCSIYMHSSSSSSYVSLIERHLSILMDGESSNHNDRFTCLYVEPRVKYILYYYKCNTSSQNWIIDKSFCLICHRSTELVISSILYVYIYYVLMSTRYILFLFRSFA